MKAEAYIQYMLLSIKNSIEERDYKKSKIVAEYQKQIQWYKSSGFENDDYWFVYVFYCCTTRLHKIGITKDWLNRFKTLQYSGRQCLRTVLILALPNYKPRFNIPTVFWIENFIKKYYQNKSMKGEWFKFNKYDVQELHRLFMEVGGDDVWIGDEAFFYC